jgi:hypothetical protein
MKRLYNEYSACPYEGHAEEIRNIMEKAFKEVWNIVITNDLCPRDSASLCHEVLSVSFSEEILRSAMKMRKFIKEKTQKGPL